MLNVDDKVDEKIYEEKNEDDKDDIDDDDKIERLVMKNIISKIYDDFIVLITLDENNDELPKSQPHGCSNTLTEKISSLRGCNQIYELQDKWHSNPA